MNQILLLNSGSWILDSFYPIVVVVAIVIVIGNHMNVSVGSGFSGFRDFGRRIDDDHDHDDVDEKGNSSCLDSVSYLNPLNPLHPPAEPASPLDSLGSLPA
jgi:hypothetical protein